MRHLGLPPLIRTGISSVPAESTAASTAGQVACATEVSCPSRDHSSSAMCGVKHERTIANRSSWSAVAWAPAAFANSIMAEIAAGVPRSRWPDTILLPDRREAIEATIKGARPGDVVLIAGKGHERYQIIGNEHRTFDDRAVAAEAVAKYRQAPST